MAPHQKENALVVETFELTKHYAKGRVKALDKCSLRVEKGKIFGLLGPNGAGKTTLVKTLLGIIHPTSGSANILGESIHNYHVHAHVGYLAENHRFPDFLTARQILYYYGKMSGLDTSVLDAKIPELLDLVHLSKWANTKSGKFSKGMAQRLGLAHALLNDPALLFLDEPTDGIDPVGRKEIRDLLLSLKEQGKTIFINSHQLSEVERISDEIAILKNGKVLKTGRVESFTSVKRQYRFKVRDGKISFPDLCTPLKIQCHPEEEEWIVTVEDDRQLNRLIDALRKEKVTIQSIMPYKITLEDYFIDVIEEGAKA